MTKPTLIAPDALIDPGTLATWDPAAVCVIQTGMTRDIFEAGHIPGSVFWPLSELFTPDFRLRTDPVKFGELLSRSGIKPDTRVVCSFDGDPDMAGWAAWLFWIVTGFGHSSTFVLDGGAPRWQAEGHLLTSEEMPLPPAADPVLSAFHSDWRATLAQVREAVRSENTEGYAEGNSDASLEAAATLLDARSEAEFQGQHFFDAPPQPGEQAGHIPGAQHLPHTRLLQADGTFQPPEELRRLCRTLGLDPSRKVITYCAVGIRSAVLWFALTQLLDFSNVRNYDGSWNQWSRSHSETALTGEH